MTFESERIGFTQSSFCTRLSITIPAAAGNADTISNIAPLTAKQQGQCFGIKILGFDTTGASRAALVIGDAAGTLYQYVAAGADYTEPNTTDHTRSYFRAAAGAAITNVCVVLYMTGP